MSVLTEDWITIDALVVRCIVGVLDRERHTPQAVHIDMGLQVDLTEAADRDDLAATVNYANVTDQLRFLATQGRFRLIETLGLAALRAILAPPESVEERAQVCDAWIRIRKPEVLGGNPIPGVFLRRRAPMGIEPLALTTDTDARRIVLEPGQRWRLPSHLTGFVIAGSASSTEQVPLQSRLIAATTEILATSTCVLLCAGSPPSAITN